MGRPGSGTLSYLGHCWLIIGRRAEAKPAFCVNDLLCLLSIVILYTILDKSKVFLVPTHPS